MGLAEASLLIKDIESAKKWSEEIYKCALHRIDSGEREFLSGKVAYAMNDLESAKSLFTIANKKSGGRCFQNEDKKYKELLDKKDIIPTDFKALFKLSAKEFKAGNFSQALSLLYDCLNIQQMDPIVHLQKGKCHFELGEFDHAADSFTRAYMLDGLNAFKKEDKKYLEFLKTKIEIK
jgi:tetratricopeptide (TPR) repeat protein